MLAITSEYGTGLVRSTFTAVPRRARVLVSKAFLVGAAVLVVGLLASTVAFVTPASPTADVPEC